ncbi:MAG: hypothetical protein Q8Q52_03770 [Acidimicrobiia bacterium]|nr:hypothetical protein [Acidimicrobiia bacterium]
MARPKGRLEDALKGITIGAVRDLEDFRKLRELDGLNEIEEQVHLRFSGRAEEFASWATEDIEFANNFVDATGQRDSPFDRPHFTYGATLDTPTPTGVLVTVMSWRTNDRNETVGARVAIGVLATDLAVKVRGEVHLTFQGYGYAPTGMPDDIGV